MKTKDKILLQAIATYNSEAYYWSLVLELGCISRASYEMGNDVPIAMYGKVNNP